MTVSLDDAPGILRRARRAREERQRFEADWQQVARYVLPSHDFTGTPFPSGIASGARGRFVFTGVPEEDAVSLASAIHGLLVNPSIIWALVAPDQPMSGGRDEDDEQGQAWLWEASMRLLAFLGSAASGFPTAAYEICLGLVTFGTAIQLTQEKRQPDGSKKLKIQARELASMYVLEDSDGCITEQYNWINMSLREIAGDWGVENLSKDLRDAYNDAKAAGEGKDAALDVKYEIVHAVCRRDRYDRRRADVANRPWGGVYVEVKSQHLITGVTEGWHRNPYQVVRWDKMPGSPWGSSPSMRAMPTIKTLNVVEKDVLQAGELAVRPPIMLPAGQMEGPTPSIPGAQWYFKRGTTELPRRLELAGSIPIGEEMIARLTMTLHRMFFLDALSLPEVDRMTAEEVITRRQQGLLKASPVLSRLFAEWLDPTIQHAFAWMVSDGMMADLGPPPPSIRGRPLKVHYTGPMALTQRASIGENWLRFFNLAAPLIQADPSIMGNFDGDYIARMLYKSQSNHPAGLRPMRMVRQARDEQNQQARANAMLGQAQAAAAAGKDAASAIGDLQMQAAVGAAA